MGSSRMEGQAESSLLGSSGVYSDGPSEVLPEVLAKPRASLFVGAGFRPGGGFRRASGGFGVQVKSPRPSQIANYESRRASSKSSMAYGSGPEEQSCSSSHVTPDELPVPGSSNEQDNLDLTLVASSATTAFIAEGSSAHRNIAHEPWRPKVAQGGE